MKRYRILLAAVAMQMCLGATYAWSVFVLPLKQITSILQSTAQLPFSLFYLAFPATMIVTGTLLPKIGPLVAQWSAACFSAAAGCWRRWDGFILHSRSWGSV